MGLFGTGNKKVSDGHGHHYPNLDAAHTAAVILCSQLNSGIRPLQTPPETSSVAGIYNEADDKGFVHSLKEVNGKLWPRQDYGKAKKLWEQEMGPPHPDMGHMVPRRHGRNLPPEEYGILPYLAYPNGPFGDGNNLGMGQKTHNVGSPMGAGPCGIPNFQSGPRRNPAYERVKQERRELAERMSQQYGQGPGPLGGLGVSRHDWADMAGNRPPRASSKHPFGSIKSPDGKHSIPRGAPHSGFSRQHPPSGMPSEHPSQHFGPRKPSHSQRIPSQQFPNPHIPSHRSVSQQPFPGHHSLPAHLPSHPSNSIPSNLSMQAQPAHTVQLPPRPGKIREGERLPTGMVDPMATTSNHEFGYHGLRAHVPGMTRLDVPGGGGPDDPRGAWGLLENIQRLGLGGGL